MNSTTSSTFACPPGDSPPAAAAVPPAAEEEEEVEEEESQQNGLLEWDVALRLPGAVGLPPTPSRKPPPPLPFPPSSLFDRMSHSRYASLVGNSCSTSWNFEGKSNVRDATTLAALR